MGPQTLFFNRNSFLPFLMMNEIQAAEKLQQFAVDKELPFRETALFGVKCPYCGKSDRIRTLEHPEELKDRFTAEEMKRYSALWMTVAPCGEFLGICKFCLNIIKLLENRRRAEAL
ncbi:MAG: hypothetical protein A2V65_01760 [Deltaproteobacteria bacterium RBG_13_49_15]|nr:MAG: hypothetical protein A2V65_01760 [Deltaproteobacteria bacterium RBG_13_49_15]